MGYILKEYVVSLMVKSPAFAVSIHIIGQNGVTERGTMPRSWNVLVSWVTTLSFFVIGALGQLSGDGARFAVNLLGFGPWQMARAIIGSGVV